MTVTFFCFCHFLISKSINSLGFLVYGAIIIIAMENKIERDLGEQPIGKIMAELGLKPNDLVSNSTEQITHKMVGRAVKGRRLNLKIQYRILNALNKASGKEFTLKDLFNY